MFKGKKRYKCKECGKTYREGDLRERYRYQSNYRFYLSTQNSYDDNIKDFPI